MGGGASASLGDPHTEYVPGFLLEMEGVQDSDHYLEKSTYDTIMNYGNTGNIYQLHGNQSCDSTESSIISVYTDKEVDSGPLRC